MFFNYLFYLISKKRDSWHKILTSSSMIFLLPLIISFSIPCLAAELTFSGLTWQTFDHDNAHNTEFSVASNGRLTIKAEGMMLDSGGDEYAASYLNDIDGNFSVTVKVLGNDNSIRHHGHTSSPPWSMVGIMVRNDITLASESTGYSIMAATIDKGFVFKYDSDDDGKLDTQEYTDSDPSASYSCWLKLEKTGTTFTGSYKLDQHDDWTSLTSQTISSAATIQDIGLFVCSYDTDSHFGRTEGVFDDFTSSSSPIETTHTITLDIGDNGSITPPEDDSTTLEVSDGANQTFTVTPDIGYEVTLFEVGGSSQTLTGNQYTLQNISQDYTISAEFSAITYTIRSSAGDNGTINPLGDTTVAYNGNQTYVVTPDDGYEVDTVTVGEEESAELTNDEYIFLNVTADSSIYVSFKVSESESDESSTIAGCATNSTTNYNSGFDSADFDLANMSVSSGTLLLATGADAIDPENIVIPFEQEVSVSFLIEDAGYVSDFGWMLYDDAVDDSDNFKGWNNIPSEAKHPIFHNIRDDSEGTGGNGIFDSDYGNGSFPTTESGISTYDDGTDHSFSVDGDGTVTAKDMKKTLGTFAAGTEIVFFLTADKDWNTSDTNGVFFTKKDWNPDTYGSCGSGTFNKDFYLGNAAAGNCNTDDGWLSQTAIDRMSSVYGITLEGTYTQSITSGQKFKHVIVGAPSNDPDQWILGWEDIDGGGDVDYNDLAFRIERRTGGMAQLKTSEALEPSDTDAYYTAVTFEVWDNMPCSGDTDITYYVSIDNGVNWVEITDWDTILASDASKVLGSEVSNWTPGTPQYTYRSRRIDFAGRDLFGRALVWKAELLSEDSACGPAILDVGIDGNVSTNGSFSRGEPVVLANVIYSGSYETPSLSWSEKVQRGHLTATRLYDPENTSATSEVELWDAGTVLNSKEPSARVIYTPDITLYSVTDEVLATGDGSTASFSGTLAHYPVSATTLTITDQTETFEDEHTDELDGNLGGSGTINRFTGAYTITFNSAPGNGIPIKANYSYYSTSTSLIQFNTTNISSAMLGLDNTYVIPDGFTYDFNGDDKYNNVDSEGNGTADDSDGDWLVNWIRGYSDGSSTKKEWILGPIDHSVPAILTPPGKPAWYYGTAIEDSEKTSFDTYRTTYSDRQTIVLIGSRDGMLHAFDGGKFRWGDNPDTVSITENRGYFLWESGNPNYGTGEELWAFIPANLVSRLKNNKLSGDDRAYVDASPALADVYVNGAWRTVLLAAEGNGGDTVFCLDVTTPTSPAFMWEFSDPDLFRSRSSPAVAQIGRIIVDGTAKWVAFFVSGKSYDATLYPSIYMIDISDGSVLQRIFLNAEAAGIGGVPSGQPAIVDSDGNGYTDRVYVGTDKGYLYKVNIPDDPDSLDYSISHCVINTDFEDDNSNTVPSSQQYHPIYASPTVFVDSSNTISGEINYSVKIFFGTGDSPYYDEDINTSETTYYFFAYVDESDKGTCDSSLVSLDWFYELPSGHRVFASAFAAAGTIYFGTSTAETEDPCETSNEGKLLALNIEDGTSVYEATTGNILTAPIVEDKHLYVRTPEGLISLGGDEYNNAVKIDGTTTISTRMWREIF